jgi:hypothetical protein
LISQSAQIGVSSLGFRMTVLPETSAGVISQSGIAIGKFHGAMQPTTPFGLRRMKASFSETSLLMIWPTGSLPNPAAYCTMWSDSMTSARPSLRGLPHSRVTIRLMPSTSRLIS